MELFQGLLDSIYNSVVHVSTDYFRFTFLSFLIVWVILKDRLVHFRIQPKPKTKAKIIFREIGYTLLTFVSIGVVSWVLNILILHGRYSLFYETHYKNISDYGWFYLVLSIFLMLVVDDTYFYWVHRFLHTPIMYQRIHKIHHLSVDPNPFTTYSFHFAEAGFLYFGHIVVQSIFPVHDLAVRIWVLLTLTNSIIIHLGYEIYPSWFTQSWLTNWKTPSTHHNMHHEKVKGNYGLFFTWWDKLMGTEFSDYPARLETVQEKKTKH